MTTNPVQAALEAFHNSDHSAYSPTAMQAALNAAFPIMLREVIEDRGVAVSYAGLCAYVDSYGTRSVITER